MKRLTTLFLIGATLYIVLEIFWRGYSHWTMFPLSGLLFVLVGRLNDFLPWEMPLLLQMLLGGLIITLGELLAGCIVNLWLGWSVWDYSALPFNLWGQICLQYFGFWVLLSCPIILLDDLLCWLWYKGEKPHYRILTFALV